IITGAANPEQIERPDLKQLPDFATRFHIDDLPEDAPPKGERIFRYRLRPKSERVREIPPLLFHYWNPRLSYFATTATPEQLVLKVTPRAPTIGAGPLEAPDFLLESPNHHDLRKEHWPDESWIAVQSAAILIPPLLFLLWYAYWRSRYPSAAKLAQLR